MQVSNFERLALAAAISAGISLLPVMLPMFQILLLPGTMTVLHFYQPRFITWTFKALTVVSNAVIWFIGLYLGSVLWRRLQTTGPTKPAPPAVKAVWIFWLVLLFPWLIVAPLSGMAFDGGHTAEAYAFFWSVWSYPVALVIATILRKWVPWIVLLPTISFAGCTASELLHKAS